MILRKLLLCGAIALGAAAVPIASNAEKVIVVQSAPPAVRVETVPEVRSGYVWAPGYWGWNGHKHAWVKGHMIRERAGYHWAPHRWEERDGRWHLHEGSWER
jgi:WXXGXW repeat (2 copies)